MPKIGMGALIIAAALAIGPACTTAAPVAEPDPVLVLDSPGEQSQTDDIVVVSLSGHEVLRQAMGSSNALPTLHVGSAQVAFWRPGFASTTYELVVWNIGSKSSKVIATSATPPAITPLWSAGGTEVISLLTSTSINWTPGATFDGVAEISVATVLTGQSRTLATDIPFLPSFANDQVIAGESFYGDKTYLVVDARSGRTVRRLSLSGTAGVLPTADPDVVIAVRETDTPGEATYRALNTQTGAELRLLGQMVAQPMPSWPGRNEVVFVDGGELKAFDYRANAIRVVGPFEGAVAALGFDALGTVLLAAHIPEPFQVTFTVAGGALTSAARPVRLDPPLFGRGLGLVRITAP
jgi:hypothetical protein